MINISKKIGLNSILLILLFLADALSAGPPTFLIIGAQKSGTTALQQYLNQHPNVMYMSGEVHFFDLQFQKGVEWYLQQFSDAPGIVSGDKSPYYIFHPSVAKRVFSLFPKVKIIAILRNPVDRAYSHYWHNVREGTESLSFEEALAAEKGRLVGLRKKFMDDPNYNNVNYQRYSYVRRGLYADQLRLWFSFFPREQILILTNDELKKKPKKVMERVFAFLNIPNVPIVEKTEYLKKKYAPMNEATREKLSKFFAPYNEDLEKLLDVRYNWK